MPTFPSAARAFLAVTAILALPLASAVPQTVLTSTTASWDGTASGTLAGASHWWPNSTTPTPAESFFDLHGAEVRAEWDTAALYLDASPAFLLPAQPSHGGATYTNAALQGASSGPDRALYVFPLEGQALQVATSCAAAQASTQDHIGSVSHANTTRGTITADTANTLQVTPCPNSTVMLRGDFLVVLWNWNANLQAREGNAYLWSGKAQQDTMPGAPDTRPYASRAQQVYLTVHNGTMTLPSAAFPSALFLNAAHLTGAASLILTDAAGTVAGQHLEGHRLRLFGPLNADLGRDSDNVAVQITTAPHGGDLDGKALPLATTTAPTAARWPWAWLLGGLGAVLVPAVAVPLLRRRMGRPPRPSLPAEAADLTARLRAQEAEPLAVVLVAHHPTDPDAHHLLASVLAQRRDYRAAFGHRRNVDLLLGNRDPYLKGENALQAALLATLLEGQAPPTERDDWRRQARRCLRHAFQVRPDLRAELDRYPELAGAARALEQDADGLDWSHA